MPLGEFNAGSLKYSAFSIQQSVQESDTTLHVDWAGSLALTLEGVVALTGGVWPQELGKSNVDCRVQRD